MHKSISEGTAHLALKQMGYNNSRPHWGLTCQVKTGN